MIFLALTALEIGLWIAVLFTFVVITMTLGQVLMGERDSSSSIKERIERLNQLPEDLKAELPKDLGGIKRPKSLFAKIDLKPLLSRFTGEAYFASLEKELARADLPLRVSEFLILRLVLVLIGVFAVLALTKNILIALLSSILFLVIHKPFIGFRKQGRINKFSNQLAEFLILIVNSLRAGQTFMQGADIASKESPEPIASEFKQVIKEVSLGMEIETSMDNLYERVPSEDLKIVIAAYTIQRKVGGNLANIFETTAATIRERIKIKGQINTLTTQGKLSGLIVGAIPYLIGVIMYGMMPDMMNEFFADPLGKAITAGAVVLQLMGALWIKKIVTIEI